MAEHGTCCRIRRKVVVGIIAVLPEDQCGVSDAELADVLDFKVKARSGKPVIAFRFCPWCGTPFKEGSERRITDAVCVESGESIQPPVPQRIPTPEELNAMRRRGELPVCEDDECDDVEEVDAWHPDDPGPRPLSMIQEWESEIRELFPLAVEILGREIPNDRWDRKANDRIADWLAVEFETTQDRILQDQPECWNCSEAIPLTFCSGIVYEDGQKMVSFFCTECGNTTKDFWGGSKNALWCDPPSEDE